MHVSKFADRVLDRPLTVETDLAAYVVGESDLVAILRSNSDLKRSCSDRVSLSPSNWELAVRKVSPSVVMLSIASAIAVAIRRAAVRNRYRARTSLLVDLVDLLVSRTREARRF